MNALDFNKLHKKLCTNLSSRFNPDFVKEMYSQITKSANDFDIKNIVNCLTIAGASYRALCHSSAISGQGFACAYSNYLEIQKIRLSLISRYYKIFLNTIGPVSFYGIASLYPLFNISNQIDVCEEIKNILKKQRASKCSTGYTEYQDEIVRRIISHDMSPYSDSLSVLIAHIDDIKKKDNMWNSSMDAIICFQQIFHMKITGDFNYYRSPFLNDEIIEVATSNIKTSDDEINEISSLLKEL